MRPDIAVIGGGLAGRLLAWRAARMGLRVSLYEAGGRLGEQSAAWVAAGMIAPGAESIDAGPNIADLGRRSLALWPVWLAELPEPVFYRAVGTLLLWHGEDANEARRVGTLLTRSAEAQYQRIDAGRLAAMEPALAGRFSQAFHFPDDAQLDNRQLLASVAIALEHEKVECHWNTRVSEADRPNAATLVDCRGMGARGAWPELRGVRGEVARLYAPEIELNHMLRLLHPRYAVYLAPRPGGMLVVGATSMESDDRSEVSVRGALELLASAYSLLPGIAEARIREFATQVRPALPNNLPAIRFEREARVLRINGLYRHGFLFGPAVVEAALAVLFAEGHADVPLDLTLGQKELACTS